LFKKIYLPNNILKYVINYKKATEHSALIAILFKAQTTYNSPPAFSLAMIFGMNNLDIIG
jgi:hypothetical protein